MTAESSEFSRLIRDAISERRDMDLVKFHGVDARVAEVIVAEETEGGGTQRALYRIKREPSMDGSEHLHWTYLGPVQSGE